jgi:hypothetical protein
MIILIILTHQDDHPNGLSKACTEPSNFLGQVSLTHRTQHSTTTAMLSAELGKGEIHQKCTSTTFKEASLDQSLEPGANGKLYAAPRAESSRVLEIDPETSTVKQIGVELGDVGGGYACIAAGGNELCFSAPQGATKCIDVQCSTVPALSDHMLRCCTTADFADVDIVVGEETFKGHRVVLSRVPFFAAAMRPDHTPL